MEPSRRPFRILLILCLASGCSFSLTGPEPNRPRGQLPKCDDSKALVMLDGALGATAGIVGLSLADSSAQGAGVAIGLGAAFLLSAINGNGKVNGCRGERALYAMEMYRNQNAPIGEPQRQPPEPIETAPAMAAIPPARPGQPQPWPPRPAPSAPAQVQPVQVQPEPVQPQAPPPPPPKTQPTAKPAVVPANEWDDFWREVP
ncbi:MAG: hypothetical protein ABI867_30860 [Kofleriaceae bacterium]